MTDEQTLTPEQEAHLANAMWEQRLRLAMTPEQRLSATQANAALMPPEDRETLMARAAAAYVRETAQAGTGPITIHGPTSGVNWRTLYPDDYGFF